jgi:hypothetical protein
LEEQLLSVKQTCGLWTDEFELYKFLKKNENNFTGQPERNNALHFASGRNAKR